MNSVKCYACGDLFYAENIRRRFCAPCRRYLQDIEGRDRTREIVRMRDEFTCTSCKKAWSDGERRFDVHHLHGMCGKNSRGYDSMKDISGMITLCHQCHFNHPEHASNIKRRLKLAKKIGKKLSTV